MRLSVPPRYPALPLATSEPTECGRTTAISRYTTSLFGKLGVADNDDSNRSRATATSCRVAAGKLRTMIS